MKMLTRFSFEKGAPAEQNQYLKAAFGGFAAIFNGLEFLRSRVVLKSRTLKTKLDYLDLGWTKGWAMKLNSDFDSPFDGKGSLVPW
ncbi:hypothetical protein FCV25MIE_19137, partial [Fagus crenata]